MSKGWCDRAGTVSLFWVKTLWEPVWQTENLPASCFGSSLYERQNHDVTTAACFLVTCRFSEASCKQHRLRINTKRERLWLLDCGRANLPTTPTNTRRRSEWCSPHTEQGTEASSAERKKNRCWLSEPTRLLSERWKRPEEPSAAVPSSTQWLHQPEIKGEWI